MESVYGRISEDCRGDQSENKKVGTAPNVPKLRSRGWSLKGSGEKFRLIASFATVAKPQTRHHVVPLSVSPTHLIKIRTIHCNKRRKKQQPTVTALCEWDYVNAASFQQSISFSFFSFFFSALSSARLTQTVLADWGGGVGGEEKQAGLTVSSCEPLIFTLQACCIVPSAQHRWVGTQWKRRVARDT